MSDRLILADRPALATERMQHWCDHHRGPDPLGYLAMLRFDAARLGLPRQLPNVGAMTRRCSPRAPRLRAAPEWPRRR